MPVVRNCWPLLIFTSAESGLLCTGTNFKSIYQATAGQKKQESSAMLPRRKKKQQIKNLRD